MAKLETGLRRTRVRSGLKQSEVAERAAFRGRTLSVLQSSLRDLPRAERIVVGAPEVPIGRLYPAHHRRRLEAGNDT
jgi:hypothetical protein